MARNDLIFPTPTTPECCPGDTDWMATQKWLATLVGGVVPPTGDTRITEEGATRITEEGDTRIPEP